MNSIYYHYNLQLYKSEFTNQKGYPKPEVENILKEISRFRMVLCEQPYLVIQFKVLLMWVHNSIQNLLYFSY